MTDMSKFTRLVERTARRWAIIFVLIAIPTVYSLLERRTWLTKAPTEKAYLFDSSLPGGQLENHLEWQTWKRELEEHVSLEVRPRAWRDIVPVRTMTSFWELAEKEIAAMELDTNDDQMGRTMITEYASTVFPYCEPDGGEDLSEIALLTDKSGLWCGDLWSREFTKWWPRQASACVSRNLRAPSNTPFNTSYTNCQVTQKGRDITAQMHRWWSKDGDIDHRFQHTGAWMNSIPEERIEPCRDVINHTLVIVPRQGWDNPFHAGEDLITNSMNIFFALQIDPSIMDDKVQFVFADEYQPFIPVHPMYERLGTWNPRRLFIQPWNEGTCFAKVVHSTISHTSFLSAPAVDQEHPYASSIVWATSHYHRYLWGFNPRILTPLSRRRPINILWLSRAYHEDRLVRAGLMNSWRDSRRLKNEAEIVQGIQEGLRQMCASSAADDTLFGQWGCEYHDDVASPELWNQQSAAADEPVSIRFASLDPSTATTDAQINYMADTTILIGMHGGALGLCLYLPPGESVILELQVPAVARMRMYMNMAARLGQGYEQIMTSTQVDAAAMAAKVVDWTKHIYRSRSKLGREDGLA